MTANCLRKGHMFFCSSHPEYRVARGKECLSCRNERMTANVSARNEKLRAEEAEREALEKANDFMNRKGKDRKPRASGSDKSRLSEGKLHLHFLVCKSTKSLCGCCELKLGAAE